MTIAGITFTLLQNGLCSFEIKPGYYDAGRGPDDILIKVTAQTGCTWTAASGVSWVTVAQGASGSGDGTVRLIVQPNGGAARAVTLTIAGQPFALTQAGVRNRTRIRVELLAPLLNVRDVRTRVVHLYAPEQHD